MIKADISNVTNKMEEIKESIRNTSTVTKALQRILKTSMDQGKSSVSAAGEATVAYSKQMENLKRKIVDVEGAQSQQGRAMADISQKAGLLSNALSLVKNAFGHVADKSIFGKAKADISDYIDRLKQASGVKAPTEEYTALTKSIQDAEAKLAGLMNKQEQMKAAGIEVPSQEYKDIANSIAGAQKQLTSLLAKQDKMESLGVKKNSNQWKGLQYDIDEARNTLGAFKQEMQGLNASGGATTTSPAWDGLQSAIASTKADLNGYKQSMQDLSASGGAFVSTQGRIQGALSMVRFAIQGARVAVGQFVQSIPVVGKVFAGLSMAAHAARSAISKMGPVITAIGGGFKKLGGWIGGAIGKLKNLLPSFKSSSSGMNGLKNSSNSLAGSIFKLGNMFKLLLLRMAMRAVIQGAKQGFDNLARYSSEVNRNLSTLKSSLTQLSNSFATAFAPILNIVTPILTTLINLLVRATTAIAQFFAALTGQKTFSVAKKVQQDYAAGLEKTASKTKKNAEDLKKSIMGFDELNTLTKKDTNSDSGGGGGGGGGLNPGDMFETVDVGDKFADIVEKLKEAWRTADFTEIGAIVGRNLNEALSAIDWVKIQATLNKIAKSIATFLNGFIAATDWTLVGNTFAQAINTIFGAANTFAENFDWSNLGVAIGTGINGALNGLDWQLIRATISNVASGIASSLNGFIQTTDWALVGASLSSAINTIFAGAKSFVDTFDWSGFGTAVGTGINGTLTGLDWELIRTTISGVASGIVNTLNNLLETTDWVLVGSTLAQAINSVIDFAYVALTDFDWIGFGTGLAGLINGSVSRVDWKKIGATLSNGAKGLLTSLKTAIAKVDWKQVGKSVSDFLGAVDWAGVIKELASVIGVAIGGLAQLLYGFFEDAAKAIGDYFAGKIEECGGNVVGGLLKGIGDGLVGIAKWLKTNLVDPIVDGVKEMFGIHSPSTVFAEIGEFLIQGLANGITAIPGAISEALGTLWTDAKKWWNSNVKLPEIKVPTIADIKAALKKKWDTAKTWWDDSRQNLKDIVGNVIGKVKTKWADIKGSWESLISNVKDKTANFKAMIATKWSDISQKWNNLKNSVKDVTRKLSLKVDSTASGIKSAVNSIIDNVNSRVIAKIKLSIPSSVPIIGGQTIGPPPYIPHFAKGGVVDQATLAIIGEAGKEAVVPLENNTQWIDNLASKVAAQMGGGGGEPIDYDRLSDAVLKALISMPGGDMVLYIGDEQVARSARRGQNKIDRRINPVVQF